MSGDLARPAFISARPLATGAALVLLVALAALLCRPPLPVDETRYLAVAWEMWRGGDFLVPHLLGEPYHHKPPLLFWLIHAGWAVFGPVEWWARLVPALAALAGLALAARLARALWPERRAIPTLTLILLVGCPFWLAFATALMFDGLLTACVLLGVLGLVCARHDRRGWLLLGLGIGLGVLAKGPVVLLHLLPPALLAQWWRGAPGAEATPPGGAQRWWRWYLGVLAALALGAALALAWALPAARHGGEDYARALLWGQSVERLTGGAGGFNTHAHRWWWYLPFLPALAFPWSLWAPCWRAAAARGALADPGVRLLLCWVAPAFAGLCLIGGKQVHYLVPLLPALALLAARGLAAAAPRPPAAERAGRSGIVAVLGLIGLALAIGPHLEPALIEALQARNREAAPAAWAASIPWWCGPLVLLCAAWAWWLPLAGTAARGAGLAGASLALVLAAHAGIGPALAPAYDPAPIAAHIAGWRGQGLAVAKVEPYSGEFEFAGRLGEPLAVIARDAIRGFAAAHPRGRILLSYSVRRPPPPGLGAPLWTRAWRGVTLGAWDTATITGP